MKSLLLTLVLVYVYQSISSNLDKIHTYNFSPDYAFFIPAILVWILTYLYPVTAWRKLITMLGGSLPLPTAMRIWCISNIGRYIPGSIWVYAGLVVMAEKAGVSRRISLQGMIYSQATSNLLGIGFVLLLLSNYYNPWLLLIIISSGLIFLSPKIFTAIINLLLKLTKREPLDKQMSFQDLAYYFFLQTINWLLIGLTFFLFLRSFSPVSLLKHPELLIMMPACWTVAFLTIIAPGGLGVREVLLTVLLTPITGPEPAVVLPWIHRLIQTIIELTAAAVFWLLGKCKINPGKTN